ncbi:hypothetical protein [Saccharomonospora sp. CUA-673]|uniref:hypothetical protein n=1 Tax=Saccharomonospora sp. CUA-673 TaxID=1904969 RepID=UPI002100EF27|nr:hypothetical protein [Saccharomonospora sp. CUA-673]
MAAADGHRIRARRFGLRDRDTEVRDVVDGRRLHDHLPGAGSPFPSGGDPKAPSPDCGHTYRQTSQGQPNNTYPVSATVHWTVTWSGAGQSGTFPDLTTTSNATFAVAESQALNNAPR